MCCSFSFLANEKVQYAIILNFTTALITSSLTFQNTPFTCAKHMSLYTIGMTTPPPSQLAIYANVMSTGNGNSRVEMALEMIDVSLLPVE